jgi:hypothetical protein
MRAVQLMAAAGLGVGLSAGALGQVGNLVPGDLQPQGLTTDRIGYLYYNEATGEKVVVQPGGTQRGQGEPVWLNLGFDQCACGEWYFMPQRDSATGQNDRWLNWGDIAANTVVDSVTVFYATTVHDQNELGVPGFNMKISFFDGVDTPQIEDGVFPYHNLLLTDLPGSDSGISGWLVTVDLSRAREFEVGDSDGIDNSGNGFFSHGNGIDQDGDGLIDFAFGMEFVHPLELVTGLTGNGLAGGPVALAPGDVDMMALYTNPDWGTFDGFFNFGRQDCSPGCDYAWIPWASPLIGLYGRFPNSCNSPADLNGDGVLDFFDVQSYLNLYAARDLAADLNNDGAWDFFDVQIFLGLFSAGCP